MQGGGVPVAAADIVNKAVLSSTLKTAGVMAWLRWLLLPHAVGEWYVLLLESGSLH